MQLYYDFNEVESSMGVVSDKSGHGNNGKVAQLSFGLGPPWWEATTGVKGTGGYYFVGSVSTSRYIECKSLTNIKTLYNGSISFWMNLDSTSGLGSAIPFCISNGFVATKTELSVTVTRTSTPLVFTAKLELDGAIYWQCSFTSPQALANNWVFVTLTHTGNNIKPYLQGMYATPTYKVQENKAKWIADLFATSTTNKADRLILGGAPRMFSPFIQYGYTGYLDEIKIWDIPLPSAYILSEYNRLSS